MLKLLPPAGEVGTIGDAMIPADLYFLAREPVALVLLWADEAVPLNVVQGRY